RFCPGATHRWKDHAQSRRRGPDDDRHAHAKYRSRRRDVAWIEVTNHPEFFMNATRILPDLQCALLCEDVRPEANGNCILVGVIGLVRVPQVPVTAFKLCVFNRW